ncbi:MAG: DUF1702 family protein [Planctomycetota bacterium]|nr:DUF1702 family protein [Planctomycetota bacterium]
MFSRLFTISPQEVTFARRGFVPRRAEACRHLEEVGTAFVMGYNLAVTTPALDDLIRRLNEVCAARVGFAFEGAAMGLGILDALPFAHVNRWSRLLSAAPEHNYMLHVGLGWAWARIPWKRWRLSSQIERLDPLLCWLAIDGLGFHDAFFSTRRVVTEHRLPRVAGYSRRAFDQGVGRALWFVCCADPQAVRETLVAFPADRHQDLWAGVGLAMTYAGGVPVEDVASLVEFAGPHRADLAQGAAFAAQARRRAGNPTEHADSVCQWIWGRSADATAQITDDALVGLNKSEVTPPVDGQQVGDGVLGIRGAMDDGGSPVGGSALAVDQRRLGGSLALPLSGIPDAHGSSLTQHLPAYEIWRLRIQHMWSNSVGCDLNSAPTASPLGATHVVSVAGPA